MDSVFRVRRAENGLEGFMCPPGHPNHIYVVHEYYPRNGKTPDPSRRKEADGYISMDYALSDLYTPQAVKDQIQRIFDKSPMVPSRNWIRHVYGYFRNSYAPESGSRNVSDAVSTGPADRHLGYLMVKRYFPDHEPDIDLIRDPGKGYGSYPCTKCGQRVQYEAKVDGYVISPSKFTTCPNGGSHLQEGASE